MKNKKGNLEEIDGDCYRYYLLAGIQSYQIMQLDQLITDFLPGTTHPYPDDTFYSVGRVPRKLLIKYLGVKVIISIHFSVNYIKEYNKFNFLFNLSPDVPGPAPEAAPSPPCVRARGLAAVRGDRPRGAGRGRAHLARRGARAQDQELIYNHIRKSSLNFIFNKLFFFNKF